jgi:adenylosuccinate synthase
VTRRAFLVTGLGFGDEGKGSIVDWLARRHTRDGGTVTVVRANGGPQAAHHVMGDNGKVHCASQLGAGVLVPGVRAHLARTVLVDPLALIAEGASLRMLRIPDGIRRLSIDPRCVVVTPFHRSVNRIQELARGGGRHGSCGRGVAQAQLDAERGAVPSLRMGDLADRDRLAATLLAIWRAKVDLAEQLADEAGDDARLRHELAELRRPESVGFVGSAYEDIVRTSGLTITDAPALGDTIVVEGAQGLLLDRELGFWPHVTPSRTTFAPGRAFLEESGFAGEITQIGVLRAYATRHGAGPFVTEDAALTSALPEAHNKTDRWQGRFRAGWFDAPAARYAIEAAGGVDALAITNVDRLARTAARVRACADYGAGGRTFPRGVSGEALTRWWSGCVPWYVDVDSDAERLVGWIESEEGLGRRVSLVSAGPSAAGKIVCDDDRL